MKIALISRSPRNPNIGDSGANFSLADALIKVGAEVDLFFGDDLSVPHPFFMPLAVAFKASQLIGKYDVLDIAYGDAWLAALRQKFTTRKKSLIITRAHSLGYGCHLERLEAAKRHELKLSWKYPFYHGGFILWIERLSMRLSDISLVLNYKDLSTAFNSLGIPSDKLKVVDNGLPDNFLSGDFVVLPDRNDKSIKIAIIGRIDRSKGKEYIVSALNRLLIRYPQLKVGFFGCGSTEKGILSDFTSEIRQRVKVVPRYEHRNLPNLLGGYHITIFASLSDAFGLAALEGMACGLALICTSTAGVSDRLKHGKNVLIIESRSVDAIEQAVMLLMEDRKLFESIRRDGHARAQDFSWSRIAIDTLSIYEEFLAHKCHKVAE